VPRKSCFDEAPRHRPQPCTPASLPGQESLVPSHIRGPVSELAIAASFAAKPRLRGLLPRARPFFVARSRKPRAPRSPLRRPPPPPPKRRRRTRLPLADFTWLNGNSRQTRVPSRHPAFTARSFMTDLTTRTRSIIRKGSYAVRSTTSGRNQRVPALAHRLGATFNWKNMRGRIMTQSAVRDHDSRNDSSPSRGQWDLSDAYRYLTEAMAAITSTR